MCCWNWLPYLYNNLALLNSTETFLNLIQTLLLLCLISETEIRSLLFFSKQKMLRVIEVKNSTKQNKKLQTDYKIAFSCFWLLSSNVLKLLQQLVEASMIDTLAKFH